MNKKIQISVVISAFNEEQKIRDCLESVKWADEIILVDNKSEDKTVEIAKKYTQKIFSKTNNMMLNINKNFGFSKATGDWIVSLDADERIPEELALEIKSVTTNNNSEINAYWIPRKNIIFGKWIKHTGWYPDYQLRLFKNGKGKFDELHVHEMITVLGKSEYLKNNILHLNFETVYQFFYKHIAIYAPNEAKELLRKGYVFNYIDCIRFPFKEFLSRFFVREGYKDGYHGLMLSLLMAFYHLLIFSYLWEKQGFTEITDKEILTDTAAEFRKMKKEFTYWYLHEKIKTEKKFSKKLYYTFRKKLTS